MSGLTATSRQYIEEHIAIDAEKLDEEWLAQPVLYDRAQQAVVDAKRQLGVATRDLNTLKSELWLQIKRNPEDYGIETGRKEPTKDDVESALLKNKHYKNALDLVETFELELEECKNFVKSVEMKKSSLRELVNLYLGHYFAVPDIKEALKGKHYSDYVYERKESKQRERLRNSKSKREKIKEETKKKLSSKSTQEAFEEAYEREEKRDEPKRKRMLGLNPNKKKKSLRRRG